MNEDRTVCSVGVCTTDMVKQDHSPRGDVSLGHRSHLPWLLTFIGPILMTAGQIMLPAFAVVGLIIPILFTTSGASADFCEQVISVLKFSISSLIHVNTG